jgi:hypothetical protein
MECPSCGAANPDGKKFCGKCGAPLPVRCTACGAEPTRQQVLCRLWRCVEHSRVHSTGGRGITPASRTDIVSGTPPAHGAVLRSGRLDGAGVAPDPEDLREIIGTYHRCVAETVARFDGFVANYMGDGVLVYFGYPQAHEDDAEQAVRAGLALANAARRGAPWLPGGPPCRILP